MVLNLNTFFQICIYICLALIVFTLAINFVNGMGIFEEVGTGATTGTNTSNIFVNLAGIHISEIWAGVLFGTGLLSLGLAWMTHSAIPVGAWIFSSVFWTSYESSLGVLTAFSIPPEFQLIGTVVVAFLWVGALAGMFSGSG